ncbi:helix-turn-helix domain-containing protein [Saccharothrix yanglingensis]|uniref:Transcriptional regulator n=1 Tax=Saccharothrix yanglingensis TaxID=659496 RepID=A0ABU0X4C0_9PSEU|nr:helix-turn-helix transcriptional regulator [Saccharothrix yanglingensis]MDQ2586124.1 transcriptional regulator [Saccharothrix yanglingensis]
MGRTLHTIPRRLLGGELRRLRLAAGRSQVEAARAIGRDQSRINKLEGGRTSLNTEELAALLDFFGADPAERGRILDMGVEARKRHPRSRAYVDQLPHSYRRLATLEAQATTIMTYERGIFPGLLQCAEYAEAAMRAVDGLWWEPSYEERANRVAFRMERQRMVLEGTLPEKLVFVVTDDALNSQYGDHRVMRRQVEHVLALTADREIELRLLSSWTRDNPAPSAGFTLLHFDQPAPPVGFMSVAFGPSPYLSDPDDTAALERTFQWLLDAALDPAESRDVLEEALKRS